MEKPIIFNAEMVNAVLDGKKTQTRRPIKDSYMVDAGSVYKQSGGLGRYIGTRTEVQCPFGAKGDTLWVRETFCVESNVSMPEEDYAPPFNDGRPVEYSDDSEPNRYWMQCHYRATDPAPDLVNPDTDGIEQKWKPSIHMPRWASRILLKITDVRIERLNEISEEDAVAEGVTPNCALLDHANCEHNGEYTTYPEDNHDQEPAYSAKESYQSLWNSIYGENSWGKMPWVWVIEFKRVEVSR